MTKQQIEIVKRLSTEYGLTAESPENTLIYIGLGYGLSEDDIRNYLGRDGDYLLEKHLHMLCMILGIKKWKFSRGHYWFQKWMIPVKRKYQVRHTSWMPF